MSRIGGGGDEDKTKVPETGTNGSGHSKIGGGSDTSTSSTDDVIKALTGKKLDLKERQAEAADRYNPYSSDPAIAKLQRQKDVILNGNGATDKRAQRGLAELDKQIDIVQNPVPTESVTEPAGPDYSLESTLARLQKLQGQKDMILSSEGADDPRARRGLAEIDEQMLGEENRWFEENYDTLADDYLRGFGLRVDDWAGATETLNKFAKIHKLEDDLNTKQEAIDKEVDPAKKEQLQADADAILLQLDAARDSIEGGEEEGLISLRRPFVAVSYAIEQIADEYMAATDPEEKKQLSDALDLLNERQAKLMDALGIEERPLVNWEGRDELIAEYKRLRRKSADGGTAAEKLARQLEIKDMLIEGDLAAGNGYRSYSFGDRLANIFSSATDSVSSSIVSAAGTLPDFLVQNALGLAGEISGKDYLTEDNKGYGNFRKAVDTMYGISKEMGDDAEASIEAAKNGLSKFGQFGVDLAENALQMGFDAGIAAVTGGSALIPMGVRSFGSGAQEARDQGANINQQFGYGLANAAIETVTEIMFDGVAKIYGAGAADKVVENLIYRLNLSRTGQTALRLVINAGGEGFEEIVAKWAEPFAKAIYSDKTVKELRSEQTLSDYLYSALVGFALGAAGGGVNVATGANAEANDRLAMRRAGLGIEGMTDSAWDVLTGTRSAEEVNARERITRSLLGLDENGNAPAVNTPAEVTTENAPTVNTPVNAPVNAPVEANPVSDALAPIEQTSIDANNVLEQTQVNTPVEQSASETQNNAENEDVYRERGESRNIRTDEARAEELRNFKEQNPDMYKVVRNEKTLQKALDIFDTQGVEGSAATLEQALADARNGKKLPLEMVPLHKLVCDELAKAGQVERANRISSDLGAELTYAGQLGQANIILRNSSATAKADAFAKTLDKLIGENKAAVDQTAIDDLINRYRAADTDEARNAVLDDAITAIAQSSPSNLRDMFTALRYTNMLGNFKTQGRNILGNTGMLLAARGKNRILAMEQAAVNAVSNMLGKGNAVTRTNTLTTDGALFKEAWKMFAEDQKAAYGEGKYSDVAQGNQAIREKKTVFKWNWKGEAETRGQQIRRTIADVPMKVLEGYRKATSWAMEQGDVIFQKITYAQVLADYAKAQGYKSLADVPAEQLQTMREYAVKEAQEATFHDKNKVSEAFSSFDKNWSPGMKRFSQGVIPFRQTPANVGVRMEEYSPLGVINTFVDTVNAIQGKKDVNSVLNSLAKTISGTGLATLGFILAKNGLARGKEDDEKLASYEKNVQGLGDYSIVLPDGTTVSLDWLQPESAAFFVGVEAAKYFDDGVQADDFMALLGSTSDIALNMSFLSGLSSSLDDIARLNGDTSAIIAYLTNSLISYAGQGLTNSLAGQAEQASEQYRQTTYTDPDSWVPTSIQKKLGQMSAKIPGWDYNQADYIDAWGRKQDNGPVAGRIAESFFSPAYINENRSTEVDDELKRLHESVGNEIEGTVFPSSPARSTEINGVRLSPEEYETYAVTGGQKALELVTDFINSPGYEDLDDKTKAETIKKLYGYAKLDAKNAVLEARGEEPETDKGYEKAKAVMDAAGMSWGDFFSFDANVPKKYEDLARFLLDSDFTEEQQEALYDIYNTSKTPFSTFREKEQAAKDAGFESADVFEAMLADVKAFKANVKNEYDSNGNVEAAEYIRDQDLTDEQKDTLIGEVSKDLKGFYDIARENDVGANDTIDLLLAIDATPAKGSTQNNGSISQKEMIAYYYEHPEDEWLISMFWNSKNFSMGDWDTAKGKNFK